MSKAIELVTKEEIKSIFLKAGFSIKDGESDLKPYVYEAAYALLSASKKSIPSQPEPFGYFRSELFGWTDCAETDEGAIALYEHPQTHNATPIAWRVYCPTWEGRKYGNLNRYKKVDPELAFYLARPECTIEYGFAGTDHIADVSNMVELSPSVADHIPDASEMIEPRLSAIELQAQEVGIIEPVTDLLNPV